MLETVKITPRGGCEDWLSASHKNKLKLLIDDMRWFLKNNSDLTAYRVMFPQGRNRKSAETLVYMWDQFNSTERRRLKQVGENIKMTETLNKMKVQDGI